MIRTGIEQVCRSSLASLRGRRLGLLANQASTDRHFTHSRDLLRRAYPDQLTCLFSPQHGFYSEKQDNMIESDHAIDTETGLPVHSLYGETRKPSPAMFADIDVLLVDLVDVGTRVYTFIWTVVHCLETAAEIDRLIETLDGADACVHFPHEEAFGLVVAESLSRNLRFFGTNVGGIRDIVEGVNGAELYGDLPSLENGIAGWLDSGAPRTDGASSIMSSRYHPEVIGRRHLEIYREVLGRRYGKEESTTVSLDEFIRMIQKEIADK